VLNSTLSFLLVFRLNRAASRFWAARVYWGNIVAQIRSLVGGIIVHGEHNRSHQDDAIRWVAAFSIATMANLRGEKEQRMSNFAGILSNQHVLQLQGHVHPPLYAADQVRYFLNQLFLVDADSPASVAIAWTQQLNALETQLNTMIWCGGGMERIKSTPLPIVYVSHLRTFLMINLILFPWVFGPSWGWSTIPIVAASAFAWLGIECAAVEVECPFRKDRVNALNMDAYVIGLLSTIQQQIINSADRDIKKRAGGTSATSSSRSVGA
jgi:ion channel-forming bestrophin family protein